MAGRPMSTPGSSAGEVFRLIHQKQAATRTDIGRMTGLSRTAVTLRVNQLLEQGLVAERAEGGSTGGRPPVRLEFRGDAGIVLAAAIGASRAQLAVCDLAGRVLTEAELPPVDSSRSPEALLTSAVDRLHELLSTSGHDGREIFGVGVSVPGMVDTATGRSVSPSLQPGWSGTPVADFFTRRFPVPVRVDNDVNVLALAEHRLHPEIDDLLVIKASTGIGAAIIAGGRLQRGALSAAGELGHIKVADAGGAACRCGSTDCLEAVAGGWALVRELTAAGRPVGDALGVAELARTGDPEALRLVREAGRRIGEVTAAAVNLLNPALIVIGGDLAHAYEPLIAGIRELTYQRSTTAVTRNLRFESSFQHEHSGVAASAAMVLDEVLSARAVDGRMAGRG